MSSLRSLSRVPSTPTSGVPPLTSPTSSTSTTDDKSSGPPTPTTTKAMPPALACWVTPQQRRRTRQLQRDTAAHEAAYARQHTKWRHDNKGGGSPLFPLELRLVASASASREPRRQLQQQQQQQQLLQQRQDRREQQVAAWEAEVRQLEELVARITDALEGGLMVGGHEADGDEDEERKRKSGSTRKRFSYEEGMRLVRTVQDVLDR